MTKKKAARRGTKATSTVSRTASKARATRNTADSVRRALGAFPTNWVDPLLTGPEAILPRGNAFACRDIERLLWAVSERVRKALEADK